MLGVNGTPALGGYQKPANNAMLGCHNNAIDGKLSLI